MLAQGALGAVPVCHQCWARAQSLLTRTMPGWQALAAHSLAVLAPATTTLATLARRYCDDVWVIAPATHQSARSRGITLRTPLRVVELGEQRAAALRQALRLAQMQRTPLGTAGTCRPRSARGEREGAGAGAAEGAGRACGRGRGSARGRG